MYTLADYQNELDQLDRLNRNGVYVLRKKQTFHVLDFLLDSYTDFSDLTEKRKRRIAAGEQYFPREEASLYIKPPSEALYEAKASPTKIIFAPGENTFDIPSPKLDDQTIIQPYMSWHGGKAETRGQVVESGTIELKGFKPDRMIGMLKDAKEKRGQYFHRIAPSISKDRIAGRAHMVGGVIAHNSSLSLPSVQKPQGPHLIVEDYDFKKMPSIFYSPQNIVVDANRLSDNFVVLFFVHHAILNTEWAIKPELDELMAGNPVTVSPAKNGSLNCSIVIYNIPNKIPLLQKSPLIMWANSSDRAKQILLALNQIN